MWMMMYSPYAEIPADHKRKLHIRSEHLPEEEAQPYKTQTKT
jgi:hypothetical protein